jgi:putative lipase involved disintegration of autophagic bodies
MGRVVRPGEPLWLPEDRAWALALLEVEADACPECRQPWHEATDPKNEFGYSAEVIRCHACTTSSKAVKAKQDKGESVEGLHVRLDLRN